MSARPDSRPDLSKGPTESARIGRSAVPRASLSEKEAEIISPGAQPDPAGPDSPSVEVTAASAGKSAEASGEEEEAPRSSTPPNPFDESDEGEKEEDDSASTADCLSSTPAGRHQGTARPVPAPRRVSEPTPPPRPAPRVRLLHPADGQWVLRGSLLLNKGGGGVEKRPDPYFDVTFQVKARSPPLLLKPVSDPAPPEGKASCWISVFSPAVSFHPSERRSLSPPVEYFWLSSPV